jgi:hypothetical protein
MKKIFLALSTLLLATSLKAGTSIRIDSIPANTKDVESVNAIIQSLYDVISGPSGEKRNWDRMRTIFLPEARMIATGISPLGVAGKKTMTVEDYINSSGPYLEKNGFFESEIGRKTEQFGNIVHVFSTYESRKTLADEKPFMRGINSIQLWFDGKRWWIVTVLWQSESKDVLIPEKYLKSDKS